MWSTTRLIVNKFRSNEYCTRRSTSFKSSYGSSNVDLFVSRVVEVSSLLSILDGNCRSVSNHRPVIAEVTSISRQEIEVSSTSRVEKETTTKRWSRTISAVQKMFFPDDVCSGPVKLVECVQQVTEHCFRTFVPSRKPNVRLEKTLLEPRPWKLRSRRTKRCKKACRTEIEDDWEHTDELNYASVT